MKRKCVRCGTALSDCCLKCLDELGSPRLAAFLVGDLGPARRYIMRLLANGTTPNRAELEEIQMSLERCVQRIEEKVKQ